MRAQIIVESNPSSGPLLARYSVFLGERFGSCVRAFMPSCAKLCLVVLGCAVRRYAAVRRGEADVRKVRSDFWWGGTRHAESGPTTRLGYDNGQDGFGLRRKVLRYRIIEFVGGA